LNEAKSLIEAIPKAVPGNSDEATRFNKSGLENLKAEKYQEAVADFQSASAADASDAKYLSNLGYAEIYAGNLDVAKRHLYSSLVLDPTRSVAWDDLGIALAKNGLQDKAVSALLVGYRVSNGTTMEFLQHLSANEANDVNVRTAGSTALEKVRLLAQNSSARTPSASVINAESTKIRTNDSQEIDQSKAHAAEASNIRTMHGGSTWMMDDSSLVIRPPMMRIPEWYSHQIDVVSGESNQQLGAKVEILETRGNACFIEVVSGSDHDKWNWGVHRLPSQHNRGWIALDSLKNAGYVTDEEREKDAIDLNSIIKRTTKKQ
jgi:tetratricopeptide (TPR) repeat protein